MELSVGGDVDELDVFIVEVEGVEVGVNVIMNVVMLRKVDERENDFVDEEVVM